VYREHCHRRDRVAHTACDLSLIDVTTAGATGALAPAGEVSSESLLGFLTMYELHDYYHDFLRAGYTSVADLPHDPFQLFFACPPLDVMRPPEKSRLI
jgi:hypothetical protein